jgi:hypothetical protein
MRYNVCSCGLVVAFVSDNVWCSLCLAVKSYLTTNFLNARYVRTEHKFPQPRKLTLFIYSLVVKNIVFKNLTLIVSVQLRSCYKIYLIILQLDTVERPRVGQQRRT